ncbi:unnamed protein product [Caenorhabditis sp. 36 PRJEB53466]|nr:unnamed protein product [Caenorhabditis sp. 36 PRJEB53466]
MATPGTILAEKLNCQDVVVVRWDLEDANSPIISAPTTLNFIKSIGYKTGDTDGIRCAPCQSDPEQFIILPMETEAEAKRICEDSEKKGFGINNTRITVNRLIGLNGIRLRDATDCIRLWHEYFDNDELMDLMMGLIGAMSDLIENGTCFMFGSFQSQLRRNGYSDIDIVVESVDTPEKVGSTACLIRYPLTKSELYTFPQEEIIKALFHCLKDNEVFRKIFEMRFVPARTPILIFKSTQIKGMDVTFDVSVNNHIGSEKGLLLDQFIQADKSEKKRTRKMMQFVVHWARCNGLLGGNYPEEKLAVKTGFNSYIFNQMLIHFMQAATQRVLVFPQAAQENRVVEYNFDDMFDDFTHFLKEFFKYFASFDFTNKAIYGKQTMQKATVANVHGVNESALMIMDPMDCTHNISARVTEDAMKLLKGLIRNALLILKQKIFRISLLLRTNLYAAFLMRNKEPNALCSGHQEYLTFQLPEIIQTSAEFMVLLTRVLRFYVSPNHEGPSVNNLYNSMGVIFVVQSKSWIGRRNKKRQLRNVRKDTTNLHLEVMCSDMYPYEDEPIAELRVAMSDLADSNSKIVYIEMLKGQVADVRDAMHYLIDQFMANHLQELVQGGIMSIQDIPVYQA